MQYSGDDDDAVVFRSRKKDFEPRHDIGISYLRAAAVLCTAAVYPNHVVVPSVGVLARHAVPCCISHMPTR